MILRANWCGCVGVVISLSGVISTCDSHAFGIAAVARFPEGGGVDSIYISAGGKTMDSKPWQMQEMNVTSDVNDTYTIESLSTLLQTTTLPMTIWRVF